MYAFGDGLPKNNKEALKWYEKAAAQGNAKAQFNLGVMCGTGEGVLQDFVKAYMWLNLAAEQGIPNAKAMRDHLIDVMTPAQIAEAQRLAREWKPKAKD
jgi:TPR repeat protein